MSALRNYSVIAGALLSLAVVIEAARQPVIDWGRTLLLLVAANLLALIIGNCIAFFRRNPSK